MSLSYLSFPSTGFFPLKYCDEAILLNFQIKYDHREADVFSNGQENKAKLWHLKKWLHSLSQMDTQLSFQVCKSAWFIFRRLHY